MFMVSAFTDILSIRCSCKFSCLNFDFIIHHIAFKLEVALTGTALPVLVDILPQTNFHFNECPVNEHVDSLATLKNDSGILPVSFAFRPVAQFAFHPPSGKLRPGESKDIVITFKPNQYGDFRRMELMDVLGDSAGPEGEHRTPLDSVQQVIHSLHILLTGQGISTFKKKEPKFNPGMEIILSIYFTWT